MNRRRFQLDDFENLEVYVYEKEKREEIADLFVGKREKINQERKESEDLKDKFDQVTLGELSSEELKDIFDNIYEWLFLEPEECYLFSL